MGFERFKDKKLKTGDKNVVPPPLTPPPQGRGTSWKGGRKEG
jgi:hypothetical protein